MKLVPSKSGGVGRRAYSRAYAKTASAKVSDTLGKMKLRSDPIKPVKIATNPMSVQSEKQRAYKAPNTSVSFGDTGYTEEDYT